MGLELLAEVLEDDVADGGRNDGDGEVLDREDVNQGDGEPLTWATGAVELAHQEVGVEEEDDESDLEQRTQDVVEWSRGQWAWGHEMMITGIPLLALIRLDCTALQRYGKTNAASPVEKQSDFVPLWSRPRIRDCSSSIT